MSPSDEIERSPEAANPAPYRVLARKYRPADFASLIGQDAMVRVLSNAIASGRLAHAYLLTGVRGVGKTSTARIIARALNCIGPDGTDGPTMTPCGTCVHCRDIAADRHVDVIEMDAASRTGIDDVREIIDGVRYRPVSARYKVYIIDEVHMLSKQAFNALLKTLEEPPEHVKFIFATTEVRRVPVTVLSRCQRFDLRRVDMTLLAEHLTRVAEAEAAAVTPEAIALLARAADGSVRDGLSLLEQAIAHASDQSAAFDQDQARDMLGLADRTRIFDLLEALMSGQTAGALDIFDGLHESGADPVLVIQDLMDVVHWVTRIKLVPSLADSPDIPEAERVRWRSMADGLSMAILTRAWQMLIKGLGEVQTAPLPAQAAEMVLVRLGFAADLPSPDELVRQLQAEKGPAGGEPPASGGPGNRGAASGPAQHLTDEKTPRAATRIAADMGTPAATQVTSRAGSPAPSGVASGIASGIASGVASRPTPRPDPLSDPLPDPVPDPVPEDTAAGPMPASFEELVSLFREKKQIQLYSHLNAHVHLVRFEPGRLELHPGPRAPRSLAPDTARHLGEWTGRRWIVSVTDSHPGTPTLAEQAEAREAGRIEAAARDPLVAAILETFEGAEIRRVTPPAREAISEKE